MVRMEPNWRIEPRRASECLLSSRSLGFMAQFCWLGPGIGPELDPEPEPELELLKVVVAVNLLRVGYDV